MTFSECTFIILSREAYDKGTSSELGSICSMYINMDTSNPMAESHMDCNFVFIECMVGDVNIFLSKDEDGPISHCCAEIEIMIAGRERERERGGGGGGGGRREI